MWFAATDQGREGGEGRTLAALPFSRIIDKIGFQQRRTYPFQKAFSPPLQNGIHRGAGPGLTAGLVSGLQRTGQAVCCRPSPRFSSIENRSRCVSPTCPFRQKLLHHTHLRGTGLTRAMVLPYYSADGFAHLRKFPRGSSRIPQ